MSARQNLRPLYVASSQDVIHDARQTFRQDVLRGLGERQKRLLAKYFYDARGSALFDKITQLPEYYLTRAELEILSEQAMALAAFLPKRPIVVEFGSGSSRKFRLLKAALGELAAYVPVDIASEVIYSEADALKRDFPTLAVLPVAADFTAPFPIPRLEPEMPVVGFFPGSTIGNFEPEDARAFLSTAAATLGAGSCFVIGVDLVKERAVLEAAYDDSAGVTAAFNRNILTRINRELGGDFNPQLFRHRAVFNTAESRVEMHLESAIEQRVRVGGVSFRFAQGERIHTESSYKYTARDFQDLARAAGWTPRAVLLDRRSAFMLHILQNEC